ncbi:unnamed protein product [Fusarium venenatum]|uniref:Uncharacterized protein n=1 Tax=Fusarium venenatum TaxID=56646 RepID=A0A2L2T2S7_9HYPO|nr:uncharacterized protein FVRRES_12180 [Fusarium venenatum]CEI39489.1 unnamed protein product [Fusarium venenatum]
MLGQLSLSRLSGRPSPHAIGKQLGAVEARRAHNPEVTGSKPVAAMVTIFLRFFSLFISYLFTECGGSYTLTKRLFATTESSLAQWKRDIVSMGELPPKHTQNSSSAYEYFFNGSYRADTRAR